LGAHKPSQSGKKWVARQKKYSGWIRKKREKARGMKRNVLKKAMKHACVGTKKNQTKKVGNGDLTLRDGNRGNRGTRPGAQNHRPEPGANQGRRRNSCGHQKGKRDRAAARKIKT